MAIVTIPTGFSGDLMFVLIIMVIMFLTAMIFATVLSNQMFVIATTILFSLLL